MHLSRLIYASEREARSDTDVIDLLRVSMVRNMTDEITGALVVTPGSYLQLLEGPRSRVNACFGRIMRDPRHRDVQLLQFRQIQDRLFADWYMRVFRMSANPGDMLWQYSLGGEFRPSVLPQATIEQLFQALASEVQPKEEAG